MRAHRQAIVTLALFAALLVLTTIARADLLREPGPEPDPASGSSAYELGYHLGTFLFYMVGASVLFMIVMRVRARRKRQGQRPPRP